MSDESISESRGTMPTNRRQTKRSILLNGRKTSVSLEYPFWQCVKEIASAKGMIYNDLMKEIDQQRDHANLSSAVRVYVLAYYRGRCSKV